MPTHPVATLLLPISQIHPNPDQPRKNFDLAEMEELKASIKERGLINAISVKQRGEGDYLIVAGERRFRACCDLGWTEIDARIWPSTTPPDELELLSLVENLQRADLRPLEVARGYKVLNETHNMNQEAIAKRVGKTQEAVCQYLSLAKLKGPVQENINRFINLGLAHLLQICRLKTPEEQLELAKSASEGKCTVQKLKAAVNQRLRHAASPPVPLPKGEGGRRPGEAQSDPHGDAWPIVREKLTSCSEKWAVVYTPFTFTGRTEWGWAFGIINKDHVSLQRLAAWFEQLAQGIRKLAPTPSVTPAGQPKSVSPAGCKPRSTDQETAGPRSTDHRGDESGGDKSAEAETQEAHPMFLRLPETPQQWAEVEAAAKNGPGAVYGWIYGKDSYWAESTQTHSWKDLGFSDPQTGVHQLIDKLCEALERQKRRESPVAGKIDPRFQAMIDRVKACRGTL